MVFGIRSQVQRSKVQRLFDFNRRKLMSGPIIENVDIVPVRIPLKKPAVSAHGATTHQESVIIRISASGGMEGIGSVEPLEGYDDESPEEIIHAIRNVFSPLIIDRYPFHIKKILELMDEAVSKHYGSKALVEMALFDLMGKTLKAPVHVFFGGMVKDFISLNGWIGLVSPDRAGAEANEWLSRGFKSVKVKINNDIDAALERVKAVCSEVGDQMEIRVDANEALSIDTALAFANGMKNFRVLYLEQPTPRNDLDSFKAISRSSNIKLMADESVWDFDTLLHIIQTRASDFIKVKVQKLGGMWKTHQAIQIAESFGIPIVLGHGFGLSISTMAELHLAACSRAVYEGCESVGPIKMADDVVKDTVKMDKGLIAVSTAPGLGVEIDEKKLNQYRYD
jgi:muconate cycloisomerase